MTEHLRLAKLQARSALELVTRQYTPRGMVLEPWLREEESCIIWAPSGVGKTMLPLSIALAIAGNGRLNEWNAPKSRRVLYVDGEMTIQDLRDRILNLSDHGSLFTCEEKRALALQNLKIVARQGQEFGAPFFDITTSVAQEAILERVRKEGAEPLVLDNFTTLTDGLDDENAAASFKSVQRVLLELKRMGVTTILVHHSNKSGSVMRGSTALEATFEVILGLIRPAIYRPGQARFVTEFGKHRAQGDHRLASQTWTLGDHGWIVEEFLPDEPQDDPVYAALRSFRFGSLSEIARDIGVNKSNLTRRIQRLTGLGALKDGEVEYLLARAREMRKIDEERVDDLEPQITPTLLEDF